MRIVSLLPAATEMACALGLADQLVGISHDCDYPPEALERPRVTFSRLPSVESSEGIHRQVHEAAVRGESLYTIDATRLAELAPDLVLAQRQCSVCAVGESDAVRALAQIGSNGELLTFEASRFQDLPDDVRRLGRATSRETEAEALIAQMETRLDRVQQQVKELGGRRVFCLSWFNPLLAAGHWVTEMVELAGGEDGLGARSGTSTPLEIRAVEAYAPEVILLMPCGFTQARTRAEWEAVRNRPAWTNLPAVRAGRVFAVEGSLFHRPGPRLVDGVELLAGMLHPEIQTAGSTFRAKVHK